MAERPAPPTAAARVAVAERSMPGALELAALVPQAARIERRLLRALRLHLLPQGRAADEADLWASDLVELRALDGLVLRADVLELLRQRGRALLQRRSPTGIAVQRAQRLRQAHQLLLEHHVNAPPLVRLEEEVAWLAMNEPRPQEPIRRRLEVALAALVRDGRVGVARWAARALPRMPEAARDSRTAWLLSVASSDRLPQMRSPSLQPPAGVRVVDLLALAPHLGHAPLGVRRIGDRLELGAVGPGGVALMVPASEPRFVTLRGAGLRGEVDLAVATGQRHDEPIGWEPLTLRAADGRQWVLPVLSADEQRWLDGVTAEIRADDALPSLATIIAAHHAVSVQAQGRGQRPGKLVHRDVPASATAVNLLPLASDVPEGARVVAMGLDKAGRRHPVVGIWSSDAATGVTVLARTRATPQGCLGSPVVIDGRLAGVVIGAVDVVIERRTDDVNPRASGVEKALRLHLATRPQDLMGSNAPSKLPAITVLLLPAAHGQALLIGWGSAGRRRHLLVDGGPRNRAKTILPQLREVLGPGETLELLVISHADADRVEGASELLEAGVRANDIWFNGPEQLGSRFGISGAHSKAVERFARQIGRANAAFDGGPVVVPDEGPLPRIDLPDGATLTVLGPDAQALSALAPTWNRAVLKRRDSSTAEGAEDSTSERAPPAEPSGRTQKFGGDRSVNNGASLVLLFEYQGRSVLLPGDAHAAPLVTALRRLAAERSRPGLFVDVALLPHGGSRGNVTPELFDVLEAGTWAVSTDGSIFSHPDPSTIDLVARRAQGSMLAFNYRSKTTERWANEAFQREHQLRVMLPDRPDAGIELQVGELETAGLSAT